MSEQDKKIDLVTAQTWTGNWRSSEADYNKHHECNGFLIPAEDLQGALDEMKGQTGAKYVRAYLGVDTSTSPSSEKLIIVATKPVQQRDGSLIYKDLIAGYDDAELGSGGSIWDFSTACPPDCDPDSPITK